MAYILKWIPACLAPFAPVLAMDMGTHGETYRVVESNLMERIARASTSQSPTFKPERSAALSSVGLKEACSPRLFYFDPSVKVHQDIKDDRGRVLIKAGTKVNPLQVHHLGEDLLFIDGTNERHVRWAERQGPNTKWILVSGQPGAISRANVYFDQHGWIVNRLGIKQVPARVSQFNQQLKVEEVPLRGDI